MTSMIYWRQLLLGRCTSSYPRYDRGANFQDVHAVLGEAARVFALDAEDRLLVDEPWDYDRLSIVMQERIIKWMCENMK